jgi:hypothetical protein
MSQETIARTWPACLAGAAEDYARLRLSADTPQAFEDGMRTDGEPGTYEWWYFDAHLDDGTKLVVVFYTKGTGDPSDPLTPKVSINLDLADGRSIQRVLNAPPHEFGASRDMCDVRIGGNRFTGNLRSYRIHATIEDVSVDLTLTAQVPSWRPKTGHWYFGEVGDQALFAWFLAVPQGHVQARYVVNGVTHEAIGTGYHDHNWGNAPMRALIHNWYWARGAADAYSVVLAYMTAEARYGYEPLPIVLIAKDGQIVSDMAKGDVTFSATDVHVDAETGKPVANITRYEYVDGNDRYVVSFKREKTIFRSKQIEILTREKRAAADAAGFDGAYLRFTGEMTLEHYRRGETIAAVSQPALWELMYLGHARSVVRDGGNM